MGKKKTKKDAKKAAVKKGMMSLGDIGFAAADKLAEAAGMDEGQRT